MEIDPNERFNVVQYFQDGTWEYVRRHVTLDEAKIAVKHYINSVGARMGTTVEVLMTDSGDCTVFHWNFEKGIVFPIISKEHGTVQ